MNILEVFYFVPNTLESFKENILVYKIQSRKFAIIDMHFIIFKKITKMTNKVLKNQNLHIINWTIRWTQTTINM